MGAGVEDARGFLVASSPTRCWKAHNRGTRRNKRPFAGISIASVPRFPKKGRLGVVGGGRTGGGRQEGGCKGILRSSGSLHLLARNLAGGRGGGVYPSGRGPKARRNNPRKVKGFSPFSSVEGKEGAGLQTFDSCWPWGSAGFVGPLHTLSPSRSISSSRATWRTERSSPSQPHAEPPAESRRPGRRPCPAHFCKSLSSRHPQPSTHPAVICDSRWVRGQTCTPNEDGLY